MLFPHEDSWCEGGVQHAQLAYASYAALLAAFEVTSLLVAVPVMRLMVPYPGNSLKSWGAFSEGKAYSSAASAR